MNFASDNCGPAHPEIIAALARANDGHAPSYGAEDAMAALTGRIRALFEAPRAAIHLVATGTAANSLALATMVKPWQTVFCTPLAHIHTDECNAPEFYTGGAKLTLVGSGDKMTPEALRAAIEKLPEGDVHVPQRGALALTQVTEMGRVYSLDELSALCALAHAHDLPCYMDGARLANALEALGCTPAEMTWKGGVDAVSLGGTKNGCLGVEAVIFFDPAPSWELSCAASAPRISFPSTATCRRRCRPIWRATSGGARRSRPMPARRGWRPGCAPCPRPASPPSRRPT